jgi:hypothetical protein
MGGSGISGNYAHTGSDNIRYHGNGAALRSVEDFFDVNVFVDPVPAVHVGFEYGNYNDQYVDGVHAMNHRVQLSGFYIF